jgi:hypothetical protein
MLPNIEWNVNLENHRQRVEETGLDFSGRDSTEINTQKVNDYQTSLNNYYKMIVDNYNVASSTSNNIDSIEKKFEADKEQYRKKHDKDLQNIDLRHRQFQILQYDNFIKQQTVHLLYVLIVFLVICSLVIGLNLFFGLNKTVLTGIIILLIGFYILYLIKTLVVDDININVYDQNELDFNKPTNAEIASGKSYSEKINELSGNSKCNNNLNVLGVQEDVDNTLEQEIINEICAGGNLNSSGELKLSCS